MRLQVDRDMRDFVFSKLLERRVRMQYPFNQSEVTPPNVAVNMPKKLKRGSRDHANFFVFLCIWMRGGIQSDTACKSLSQIYDDMPWIFDPFIGATQNIQELAASFKRYGLGFQLTAAKFWVANSRIICEEWDGDIRNAFGGLTNEQDVYEQLCERLRNHRRKGKQIGLFGFQEKMVSMIIYYLITEKLIPHLVFPTPIDFHAQRLMLSPGIIIPPVGVREHLYKEKLLAIGRDLTYEFCLREKVSPIILCDALWLFSRSMCSLHPGNLSVVGERHGRKTQVDPVEVDWGKSTQLAAYEQTCVVCPIEPVCRYCVPSAPYYIQGKLLLIPRPKPPYIQGHIVQLDGFIQRTKSALAGNSNPKEKYETNGGYTLF